MKIGDIVALKKDSRLIGEVLAIDDMDMVKLKLCSNKVELTVAISELKDTGSIQCKRESGKVVHILGTEYKILIVEDEDYRYDKEADGWCDTSTKELLIFNFTQDKESLRDLVAYQKKVIRHEIIHAFLYESGLSANSISGGAWAKNEEMVDWMAIQMPKIYEAFKEAEALEEV